MLCQAAFNQWLTTIMQHLSPLSKPQATVLALSNSNFGSQDVSSLGLSLRASLDSSLSPLIMKSIR